MAPFDKMVIEFLRSRQHLQNSNLLKAKNKESDKQIDHILLL